MPWLMCSGRGNILGGERVLGVINGGNSAPASGRCPQPDAVPSNWLFYLGCEDIDKTLTLMAETAANPATGE